MEPVTIVLGALALGALLLRGDRGAAPGDGGAPEPGPFVPKGKKPCEPADTWFRETAASHKVPPEYWNKLSCSEKKQVMALGPLAVNSILLTRGWDAVKDEAQEAADKARDTAEGAVNWAKDKLPKPPKPKVPW